MKEIKNFAKKEQVENLSRLIQSSYILSICGCHYNSISHYCQKLAEYLIDNGVIMLGRDGNDFNTDLYCPYCGNNLSNSGVIEDKDNSNQSLENLEDILKQFGINKPFLDCVIINDDGSREPFTESGSKAYSKLIKILYAVEKITGINIENTIETLDNIACDIN